MKIKEILLALTSFPVPTQARTIENVVAVAQKLEAMVSAIAFQLDVQSLIALYGDSFDATGLVNADSELSEANAGDLLDLFETIATKRGIPHEQKLVRSRPTDLSRYLVDEARFRDLSIVPISAEDGRARVIAEQLIFESGRPILVLPDGSEREPSASLDNIAVAWDCSRPATRAVADALPFLLQGKQVRIFTAIDDKVIRMKESGPALSRYLARHGVVSELDEVKTGGRSIGEVFNDYVTQHKIDLLVMGGYGHSRMREFILGGATKSIFANPPTWTLISH